MNWRDLKVWQKAHSLVLDVYELTVNFTEEGKYGIISQLRRSAVSIAANIVEGQSRNTTNKNSPTSFRVLHIFHLRSGLREPMIANGNLESIAKKL